jgi:hypothetical protein
MPIRMTVFGLATRETVFGPGDIGFLRACWKGKKGVAVGFYASAKSASSEYFDLALCQCICVWSKTLNTSFGALHQL